MRKLVAKALKVMPPQPPVAGPGGKLGYWRYIEGPYGRRRVFIPIEPSPAGRGGVSALAMTQAHGTGGAPEKTEGEWRQEALKYARGAWQRYLVERGSYRFPRNAMIYWRYYMSSLDNLLERLGKAGIPVAAAARSDSGSVVLRFGHDWAEFGRRFRRLRHQVKEASRMLPQPRPKDAKLQEIRKKIAELRSHLTLRELINWLRADDVKEALAAVARMEREFAEAVSDEAVREAIAERVVSSRSSEHM